MTATTDNNEHTNEGSEDQTMTDTENPVIDPYDVAAYRAKPRREAITARNLTDIPARKPDRKEFFRVHPDEENMSVEASVIEHTGADGRTMTYLVPPGAEGVLPEEEKEVRLYLCINRHSSLFVWPCRLGDPGNDMSMAWARSRLECAEAAKHEWLKMQAQGFGSGYAMIRPRGELPDPVWPDEVGTFGDVLRKAYPIERVILDREHPVVRDIEGA